MEVIDAKFLGYFYDLATHEKWDRLNENLCQVQIRLSDYPDYRSYIHLKKKDSIWSISSICVPALVKNLVISDDDDPFGYDPNTSLIERGIAKHENEILRQLDNRFRFPEVWKELHKYD